MDNKRGNPLFDELVAASKELTNYVKESGGKITTRKFYEMKWRIEDAKQAIIDKIGQEEFDRIMEEGRRMLAASKN